MHMSRFLSLALPLGVLCAASLLAGCERTSCLSAEAGDGCAIPSPCQQLSFTCEGGSTRIKLIEPGDALPGGHEALASTGDILLANDQVVAVIDAIDHPHYLAPSGGTLIDLATVEGNRDSLHQIVHATGLLPKDGIRYTEQRLVEEGEVKALILRGHLEGQPARRVATRYEIRPCEPGIRVRTEVFNGTTEAEPWIVADGLFWGARGNLSFTPLEGQGFRYPGFDLLNVDKAMVDAPFVAATMHGVSASAYVDVACNLKNLQGFNAGPLSAMGTPRRVVQPRDYEVFERFIGVVDGDSVGPAADLALELRQQLHAEPWTTLSGRLRLAAEDGVLGNELRATLLISEGKAEEPESKRVPWTQSTPGPDGQFTVRVPTGRPYTLEVKAFGRTVVTREVAVENTPLDVGTIEVPPAAQLNLAITVDGKPANAWAFVHPADEETRNAVTSQMLWRGAYCAPLLGSPDGESPSCNRLVVKEKEGGSALFTLPPGNYDIYAAAGPFRSIARQSVRIEPATSGGLQFELVSLPLRPAGTLNADLHIHGGSSYDVAMSSEGQLDAILASDLDVGVIADHNLVSDYTPLVQARGVADRVRLLSGVETTGFLLFELVPGSSVPQVIGHWNFWSLPYKADAPYRGAAWDQLAEPGTLFTRMYDAGMSEQGVIQLNHPWDVQELGRDLGFPSALGINANEPLPDDFDGSAPSLFNRKPAGSRYRNSDYHVQEVMSGSDNDYYLGWRAFWFYVLNQGIARGGTANSDSHGLSKHMAGTPRNIIFTRTTLANFDEAVFNADVRAGHILGTNGPIIEATTVDAKGSVVRPSVTPFSPAPGAKLRLRVTAAPWVPVEEIRLIVNGETVRTLKQELQHPADPFGTEGLLRYEGELSLGELLPNDGKDAWLIVEAGRALQAVGDLDCNGIPDTGDNNSDGVIDWRDVDRTGDEVADARDMDLNNNGKVDAADQPKPCKGGVGPYKDSPVVTDRNDPRYHYQAVQQFAASSVRHVMMSAYPAAFTNPFILDLDGVAGFRGPKQ